MLPNCAAAALWSAPDEGTCCWPLLVPKAESLVERSPHAEAGRSEPDCKDPDPAMPKTEALPEEKPDGGCVLDAAPSAVSVSDWQCAVLAAGVVVPKHGGGPPAQHKEFVSHSCLRV